MLYVIDIHIIIYYDMYRFDSNTLLDMIFTSIIYVLTLSIVVARALSFYLNTAEDSNGDDDCSL